MSKTKITVLMPAYNAEEYIQEAIDSVLAQTDSVFELLVIDDGSVDQTINIIMACQDPRIRLIRTEHLGVAHALNTGLKEATGVYIARLDADDISMPGRFSIQAAFLDQHPEYVIVGSDAIYIDEPGEYLFTFQCAGHSHEEIMETLYTHCPFIHSAVMYRKDAVIAEGSYSTLTHGFEDYLLWTHLCKKSKYYNLSQPLLKVRFSPGSVTIDEKWRGKRYRELKKNIIKKGFVTIPESNELLQIVQQQALKKIKMASYYALCGKKFLLDNHQPRKARKQFARSIRYFPIRFDNYLFYGLSFLPSRFIQWLHQKSNRVSL